MRAENTLRRSSFFFIVIYTYSYYIFSQFLQGGHRGRMLVAFTTTCVSSSYHH